MKYALMALLITLTYSGAAQEPDNDNHCATKEKCIKWCAQNNQVGAPCDVAGKHWYRCVKDWKLGPY